MVPDQQLIKWLTYADVDIGLSRFVGGDYIVTDAFTHRMVGTASTSMWQMEEWAVRALLVPFRRLKEAQRALTFHDLSIEPQWIDRKRFDFGVSGRVKGIPVTSWSFMREYRATGERLVEIQRDFITYHALDPRGSGNQYELVHSNSSPTQRAKGAPWIPVLLTSTFARGFCEST